MHSLDDVPAIVEHSFDVFRVDGAREVRVTIMLAVAARRTYTLERQGGRNRMPPTVARIDRGTNARITCIILTRNSSLIKYLALMTSGTSEGSADIPGSTGVW